MADGYVEISAPEVRTYRGYEHDDPDMRVNANIKPGNTAMNANLSDAPWTVIDSGVFNLSPEFYSQSGGILEGVAL